MRTCQGCKREFPETTEFRRVTVHDADTDETVVDQMMCGECAEEIKRAIEMRQN